MPPAAALSGSFAGAVTASLAAAVPPSNYTLDCFVTNESAYNEVLARCRPAGGTTGAYLGVGPDQNFTYIGAYRPRLAIVVDARMDNLIEHLMFKVIFERAEDPLQYLALLFGRSGSRSAGRPVPDGSPEALVEEFERLPSSNRTYGANRAWLRAELGRRWPLTDEHHRRVDHLYAEFHRRQLDITNVDAATRANLNEIPCLRDIILARNSRGVNLHFLTDRERYRYVRRLQRADRVIPMLGNLTSTPSIDRVDAILRQAGERLATLYLSNVEEHVLRRYTIEDGRLTGYANPEGLLSGPDGVAYDALLANLARLPTLDDAVLVRFFFPGTHAGRAFGVFPHLEPDVRALRSLLGQVAGDRPQSVFQTYL